MQQYPFPNDMPFAAGIRNTLLLAGLATQVAHSIGEARDERIRKHKATDPGPGRPPPCPSETAFRSALQEYGIEVPDFGAAILTLVKEDASTARDLLGVIEGQTPAPDLGERVRRILSKCAATPASPTAQTDAEPLPQDADDDFVWEFTSEAKRLTHEALMNAVSQQQSPDSATAPVPPTPSAAARPAPPVAASPTPAPAPATGEPLPAVLIEVNAFDAMMKELAYIRETFASVQEMLTTTNQGVHGLTEAQSRMTGEIQELRDRLEALEARTADDRPGESAAGATDEPGPIGRVKAPHEKRRTMPLAPPVGPLPTKSSPPPSSRPIALPRSAADESIPKFQPPTGEPPSADSDPTPARAIPEGAALTTE